MRKYNHVAGFVVRSMVVILCIHLTPCFADEQRIVIGIVNSIKDQNGNIIVTKLLSVSESREVYFVELNERGKKLGDEMEGRLIEIIGKVFLRGEDKWIEVRTYREVEEDTFELT